MRAKNGVALIDSGTTAAHTPMVAPTTSRVKGNSATSRMMKGVARKPLMSAPSTRCTRGDSSVLPGAGSTRISASGMPASAAISADADTIVNVSSRPCQMRSIVSGDIAEAPG